eukprot:gene4555-849_t
MTTTLERLTELGVDTTAVAERKAALEAEAELPEDRLKKAEQELDEMGTMLERLTGPAVDEMHRMLQILTGLGVDTTAVAERKG